MSTCQSDVKKKKKARNQFQKLWRRLGFMGHLKNSKDKTAVMDNCSVNIQQGSKLSIRSSFFHQ